MASYNQNNVKRDNACPYCRGKWLHSKSQRDACRRGVFVGKRNGGDGLPPKDLKQEVNNKRR